MVRLFIGILVLWSAVTAQAVFDACTAYNPSDGIVCTMIDGVTTGVCIQNICVRNYTIPGNAARTGTGTISSSGATVTGSGTAFTSELHVGDVLTAAGETVAIVAIASNTSLSISPTFAANLSAGTAFTYTNPIVRWLDANGNAVAILDSRGFFALGLVAASFPVGVQGPTETAAHASGRQIYLQAGQGGPASSTQTGGVGGNMNLLAGEGGNSSFAGKAPGAGSSAFLAGGVGGATSIPGDPDGAGGIGQVSGGSGGYGGSGTGGAGGPVYVTGGDGNGVAAAGPVYIEVGAGANQATTPINICDTGGIVKIGTTGQTQMTCATGDITKIKNVPVAGLWNVNAFQQANAGGM